jgi:endo-1,4-beta-mannosidase
MLKPVFQLTSDGYFTRGAERIVPVGVNYWPASCGVEMWQAWPEKEIQRDLDLVQSLGLNCVRFFLLWQDFEPRSGHYNRNAFRRLGAMLRWCRARGLYAQPSLFVGWMSGGIFWPEWKEARNFFTDRFMRRRACAFAAQAASVCAQYRDCVIAVDQGNEICCLPECLDAPPDAVASWCAEVNAAVRRAFPGVLIISGNEQMQVTADTGWRLGWQPGCDLYSMHTYPNSAWHSLRFDGMTDPLGQSLLPFYLKCARAFGPVMAQEFGTLFTAGPGCDDYLQTVLPAAWDAGANGFLWWCLRDIAAKCHPYEKNAFEGGMGLVDERDQVKPALRRFMKFAASLATRHSAITHQPDVALYWPRHYYNRANALNPGNEPRALSRRLIIAHFTLEALGQSVGIVRGDQSLKGVRARTIVVTGAFLTAGEASALADWVRNGGRLVWHGVEAMTFGPAASELLGAVPIDFCAPRAEKIRAFGRVWSFRDFARDIFVQMKPLTARIVAKDSAGRPVLLFHRLGRGSVAACLAQPDETFAAQSDDRSARRRWQQWYRGMLALTS